MMNLILPFLARIAAVFVICAPSVGSGIERPNVIFLMVDDLGWTDFGCYGSDYYETPHIDKLAADGMTFT